MKLRILGATKKILDKDFIEISIAEFISITGGIIAGLIFVTLIDKFEVFPALLVLIPGLLAMQGSINGSLAARLTVDLYLKKIPKKFQFSSHLFKHVVASLFLVLFISIFLGVLAFTVTLIFFEVVNLKIILVSVISSLLAIFFQLPLAVAGVFWTFNKGLDPDDVMGPYVTVLGDIIGILSILVVILLTV